MARAEASSGHTPKGRNVESELLNIDEKSDEIRAWRIFRIMAEFVAAFDLLRQYGLAATIFGSARANPESARCQEAYALAAKLSQAGFTIITGGGGGVMEAANRGAYEAGGESVGLNIKLPREQELNQFLTADESFHYFFTRKVALAFASEVYVYFPGGFGTLDEFFEMTTLVQTKKIKPIPIVLVGREYWTPLTEWIRTSLYETNHTIDEADTHIYHLVDTADEAFECIMNLLNHNST